MARNVHALVTGKIDPRNLKLAFVAPISAIAHSDRPRLSRQAGSGIRRHGIRLMRGERLTEMLKQGQYEPMSVAEMVINLYAGTKGYLADIQVADVLSFESELLRYVKANYPEIITNIETSKKIDEETENLLKQAIPECVEAFGSTHTLVSHKEA